MSLQYSLGLCHQSISYLTSNKTFESRLSKAIAEMNVSRRNDTSNEIFDNWITLRDQYYSNNKEDTNQLEKISENLLGIIFEWIEYNTLTIHSKNITEKEDNIITEDGDNITTEDEENLTTE